MVGKFKSVAFAVALMMVASPVFAQDMMMPDMSKMGDMLDPMHIFTPAPAPAAAPMAKPMMKHHMMHHHMMHKKMMMKKPMHKKMMMKKPMMKKAM